MKLKSSPRRPRPAQRGFTLVELMIAVVVVALLASIALPSFMDSIRKSRRTDAFTAITAVQQTQERWRGNHADYANNDDLTPAWPAGLGLPATTASGYYEVSIQALPEPLTWAIGYEARAAAVAGSQLHDGNCKVLAVRIVGGNLTYGSGAAEAAFPDANRCWPQ